MTEPPNGSPFAHLDLDRALDYVGDPAAIASVLVIFLEMMERTMPKVTLALGQLDMSATGKHLHSLKGSIPMFCSAPLCEHLARVELLCKTSAAEVVVQACEALLPELECLQGELKHYLATPR